MKNHDFLQTKRNVESNYFIWSQQIWPTLAMNNVLGMINNLQHANKSIRSTIIKEIIRGKYLKYWVPPGHMIIDHMSGIGS